MSAPKVIVGRWGGEGPEVSVTIGTRVVDARVGYDKTPGIVRALGNDEVRIEWPVGWNIPYTHREFFAWMRPAPPESRWLDPASVPVGAPMRVCSKDCPFPSRNSSGPGALCAYCACKDTYVSPRMPPSALTPAPRWLGKPLPRVAFARRHPDGEPFWYPVIRLFDRDGRARRTRKVHDSGLMFRRWSVA